MTDDIRVGQTWIDNDKRLEGTRLVVIQIVAADRIAYKTIGAKRGATSDRKRFLKAFRLAGADKKAALQSPAKDHPSTDGAKGGQS